MKDNRMKQSLLIIGIICIMGLGSCDKHSDYQPLWSQVDELLETCPDSALLLLKQIPSKGNLSARDYATYCLLFTAAQDKNYVLHTSDSLINIAVHYFKKDKDFRRRAQAYYFAGQVNYDLKKSEEAMGFYLQAEVAVKKTKDYQLRGLINYQTARLWLHLGKKEPYFSLMQEAEVNFGKAEDWERQGWAWGQIGYYYLKKSKLDSTKVYLQKALAVAEENQFLNLQKNVYHNFGILNQNMGQYEQAIRYALKTLKYRGKEEEPYPTYLVLGESYYRMGQLDSAEVYLQKACEGNWFTRADASYFLIKISGQKGDFPALNRYLSDCFRYHDSIRTRYDGPRIKELELRYNRERIERENERLRNERQWLYIWVGMGVFGLALIGGYLYLYYRHRMLQQKQELLVAYKDIDQLQQKHDRIVNEMRSKVEKVKQLEQQLAQIASNSEEVQQKRVSLEKQLEALQSDLFRLTTEKKSLVEFLLKKSYVRESLNTVTTSTDCKLTDELWKDILQELQLLHPTFLPAIQSLAPDLKYRDLQLCCLIKLELSLDQISVLLQLDKRTISRYKSMIVRNNFKRTDRILLDTLLQEL